MTRASAITRLVAVAALLAAAPETASPQGQQTDSLRSAAVSAGLSASATTPRGAFGQTTNTGFGLGANMLVRLVPSSLLNVRTDFAFHSYGNVRRPLRTSLTRGVNTTNSIATLLVGPQLFAPTGTFSPYASVLGGVSYFSTSSAYHNSIDPNSSEGITYSSDAALAYGGAAGVYVRVGSGARAVRLDVGARYLRHDDVTYLTGDEVREALDEQRRPQPLRSRADYITFYVGAQAIVW